MKYTRRQTGNIKTPASKPSHIVVAVVLALAMATPALPATPVAASYSTYVRIVGPADEATFSETGDYEVIWAGNVTVPTDVYITTLVDNTWHLYVNGSNQYMAECTAGPRQGESHNLGSADQSLGATSVLAALEQASQDGGFSYEVKDGYFPGMGLFIFSVDGLTGSGAVGWNYRVWNDSHAYNPSLASETFLLGYDTMPLSPPHNQVLFYWGYGSDCYPMRISPDDDSVGKGEEFTLTAEYYFTSGWGGFGSWQALPEATVEVGGETFTTDDSGEVTIFMESSGDYPLYASKGFDGSRFYIPSDTLAEVSVSGGDSSEWWSQSALSDFSGGDQTRVDTSVSPGDVVLATGGTVSDDYILDDATATLGGEHFYDQFKLINGATLNVPPGEILRVHANYIEIDSSSSINADGKGYQGGSGGAENGDDGFGLGAGFGGIYLDSHSTGGGGAGAGHGGRGGYGGHGADGTTDDRSTVGGTYGANCRGGDDSFYLGSGGAGGAGNGTASGGNGGAGGGCVVLESMDLVAGTSLIINGSITAEGEDGLSGAATGCGGGGGGSGGTILIKGKNIFIDDGMLSVAAGYGGSGGSDGGGGGGGGGGHIKVFFESCADSLGHDRSYGSGGSGADSGQDGMLGTGPSHVNGPYPKYWYDYTYYGKTYSPVLPYHDDGVFISESYDTSYPSTDFGKILWCATSSPATEVKFQIATNTDNATWNFVGPDGTAGTYYTTSGSDIHSGHDGDRYIKYKAFFTTTNPGETAILSKVGITFTEGGITEIISFTVTDYGDNGIQFGSLDPGETDRPADWAGEQGAVTITIGQETNVDVNVQVMGTDFSGSTGTIPIGSVKYDADSDPGGADTLTGSYVTWYPVGAPGEDHVTQVYYWITIPPGQLPGDYTSTFYYQAVKSS